MGRIFAFILHREDYNTDYIGKYKDQKTFSYFDSEFVGQAFLYETKRFYTVKSEHPKLYMIKKNFE